MELKLAKQTLKGNPEAQVITLEEMEKIIENNTKRNTVFYLDRENPEKDLKKLTTFFKSKNKKTLIRELRFSMDVKDYIYEVHIL